MREAECVERREAVGKHLGDLVEDLRLDVVHELVADPRRAARRRATTAVGPARGPYLDVALLEALEGPGDLRAVVGFLVERADGDLGAAHPHVVDDRIQTARDTDGFVAQHGEREGRPVPGQVAGDLSEPPGVERHVIEFTGDRLDGLAVGASSVEEPTLLLELVVRRLDSLELGPHGAHPAREASDHVADGLVFEVLENLLAVGDRVEGVQRGVEVTQ